MMMFVVLWLFLESFEVKVHETFAMFTNTSETGVTQSMDSLFITSNLGTDKGVRDVVVPVHGLSLVLDVDEVTVGLVVSLYV